MIEEGMLIYELVVICYNYIAQYAEKYKLISKELTKIMHSAKDEIDLEYSILKESIEVKLYKLNSLKELFMREKK